MGCLYDKKCLVSMRKIEISDGMLQSQPSEKMTYPCLGRIGPTSLEVRPIPIRSGVKSDQISVKWS